MKIWQAVLCTTLWLTGLVPASALAGGESQNGTPFDLQGCIDQQLQAGSKHIVVPPGRYRVTPKNRQHLVLQNLNDLQIVADGVEMVCTETTRALTISDCTNVTLRGLVIDYDPLPFTQGRITAMSADKRIHEIELFAGYPTAETVGNRKYEIFRPDTRTLRCDTLYPEKVEVVDSRHIRITNPRGHADDTEHVGDPIVIASQYAPHGVASHAILCENDIHVRLENIAVFASDSFGFWEMNCEGTVYYRCRIDRRPPTSDPVQRADPRLRSLNADAFHSTAATKGPSYLECAARFMGDDCINICGDYHMIMSSQGKDLRVVAKHHLNIQPGDPVELVMYDGRRLPDAKAVSVQPAGSIRDEEQAFLAKQHLDPRLKTAHNALHQAYTITLDRAVEIPMGGVICATSRNGNGFTVKGCDFGFNRSRGILIKASDGEVSSNRMEACWMSAILVAPEYWWLEAGSSSNLKITGNTIIKCGGAAISIEAIAGNGQTAPAGIHRNIAITGNTITVSPLPNIQVVATDGLQIENNTFQSPTFGKPSRHRPATTELVKTENCENATVQHNVRYDCDLPH